MFPIIAVERSRPGMTTTGLNFLISGISNVSTVDDFKKENEIVDVHRINMNDVHRISMTFGCKKPGRTFSGKVHIMIGSDDISQALHYLFSKATAEVKKFVKPEMLNKISFEKNGILFSRTRLLDGQRFQETGGLEDLNILTDLNIRVFTPVVERYSPLSYSIADYIHRVISKHKGYENCYRESLNYCFIIQGMSVFREINDDCIKCSKLRKKFFETSMGPLSDAQLMIAPAFWVCQVDIFGPCQVFAPGHSMPKRGKPPVEAKVYVLMFVCPTTKACNMQVIEAKSADGIIDGINRLGCEVGVPSFVYTDQDSGIMKALSEAEVNVRDLQFVLHKEKGINFRVCPVSGHNWSGACERKIRSLQECLMRCDFGLMRLHATGYQTLCKLIENDLNNVPLGYSYGRDSNNSPILKLLCPNMLRIGRINSRALEGPITLPKGPSVLMERVEKCYWAFYNIWNTCLLPKMMKINKWYTDKEELKIGDIVYFRKEENVLSSRYTVGKITDVVRSKDGVVRRAWVQYQNASESQPRTTDRAARSLIKLFHVDDTIWSDDMQAVQELLNSLQKEIQAPAVHSKRHKMEKVGDKGLKYKIFFDKNKDEAVLGQKIDAWVAAKRKCKNKQGCCCASHCAFACNAAKNKSLIISTYSFPDQYEFLDLFDRSWLDDDTYEEDVAQSSYFSTGVSALISSVNMDLSDGFFDAQE